MDTFVHDDRNQQETDKHPSISIYQLFKCNDCLYLYTCMCTCSNTHVYM